MRPRGRQCIFGGLAERPKAAVLKTVPGNRRGFESLILRLQYPGASPFRVSECSSAWQSAWFGTRKSQSDASETGGIFDSTEPSV